jgi:SAM-dependent methyltransferase
METPEQATAYAGRDLDNAYWLFIQCFRKYFRGLTPKGPILDLGCGPAAIPLRLAKLFPDCEIHGVDGSREMLALGQAASLREGLEQQIHLFQGILPDKLPLPLNGYSIIISNSFLHHLANPMVLWQTIHAYGQPNSAVLVIDLLRPASHQKAELVVNRYMPDAPPILRQDMLLSLHAAFTLEEVHEQLQQAQLEERLTLVMATPFQFAAYGRLKN